MIKRGFTLIEVLVVLAIMTIILTIIISGFTVFQNTQALDKNSETVAEVLQTARVQTLSSKNASQYGVHIGSTSLTLFSGSTYVPGAPDSQNYPLLGSDSALSLSLTGGGTDIVFNRLTGETAEDGTITVSSPLSNRVRTITIYKTGLIEFK